MQDNRLKEIKTKKEGGNCEVLPEAAEENQKLKVKMQN